MAISESKRQEYIAIVKGLLEANPNHSKTEIINLFLARRKKYQNIVDATPQIYATAFESEWTSVLEMARKVVSEKFDNLTKIRGMRGVVADLKSSVTSPFKGCLGYYRKSDVSVRALEIAIHEYKKKKRPESSKGKISNKSRIENWSRLEGNLFKVLVNPFSAAAEAALLFSENERVSIRFVRAIIGKIAEPFQREKEEITIGICQMYLDKYLEKYPGVKISHVVQSRSRVFSLANQIQKTFEIGEYLPTPVLWNLIHKGAYPSNEESSEEEKVVEISSTKKGRAKKQKKAGSVKRGKKNEGHKSFGGSSFSVLENLKITK